MTKIKNLTDIPKPTHDYIGYAPCGCAVVLMADMQGCEKETAKEVADCIRKGYTVQRVSRKSEEFRKACDNFGCNCKPKEAEQLSLV